MQTVIHVSIVLALVPLVILGMFVYSFIVDTDRCKSILRALRNVEWYKPMYRASGSNFKCAYESGQGELVVEQDLVRIIWYDDKYWSGSVTVGKLYTPLVWLLSRKLYTKLNSMYRRDSEEFMLLADQTKEIEKLMSYKNQTHKK